MWISRRLVAALVSSWFAVGCQDAPPPSVLPAHTESKSALPENASNANPKRMAPPLQPRIGIEPSEAALEPNDPGLQLVVHNRGQSGKPVDLTRMVEWSVEPEGVVELDRSGFVRPKGAGRATILVRFEGEEVSCELTVKPYDERSWSFDNDIVPLLTRQGCNTGGCHGRADGQNGFRLSLFGYDASADYQSITRDSGSRRVDSMRPDASLLLQKATGQVAHAGGQRIAPGSSTYQLLASWIGAGVPETHGPSHGSFVKLSVEPRSILLSEPQSHQLRVVATYADGHTRDVTRLASFRTNDERVVAVDELGLANLRATGETDVIVRFGSQVVSCRISSPFNPKLAFDFGNLKRSNLIDEHIFKRLEDLKVPPSPAAPDTVFLRRASFDLTGQLPEPDEVKQFVASTDPDKRAQKVTELIARRDFLHFWKLKLGDLLQISPARIGNGAGAYEFWLERQLTQNRPWNEMVTELLTALGDPNDKTNGAAANYALDGPDAQTQAEQTARRFLGVRLRCAQCHNHPFDVWTQDDYFGLAAFFAKVDRGGIGAAGMAAMRARVGVNANGTVLHKRTKVAARPRTLDGREVTLEPNEDPRRALAAWMTQPGNTLMARAAVNWVWAQLFGRGIVDPADDMSSSNPPVHPELLEALARRFVDDGYDLKKLIYLITTSEVYGLSSATVPGNEHDQRLLSHQLSRPLTAHQMADALARATQVPNRFSELSARGKAIEVFNPTVASEILDVFGRCNRLEACAPAGTAQVSLRQAILLVGGDIVEGKVSHLSGYLARMLELSPTAEEIVEFLYMRTLCRAPTSEELSHWAAELNASPSLREASEDLFWALLNSREFSFNH
jgi:hypothetical protein